MSSAFMHSAKAGAVMRIFNHSHHRDGGLCASMTVWYVLPEQSVHVQVPHPTCASGDTYTQAPVGGLLRQALTRDGFLAAQI